MKPAFAGTRRTVAIPFGSRIVSTLPREHRRVVNGSFGDRFVEGIYLHADSTTPTIRMYDFASRTEMSVKDFTSYPSEFPFRDPTCLTRYPTELRKELSEMHTEDDVDDKLIAEQLHVQAVTRSQTHSVSRAHTQPLQCKTITTIPSNPKKSVNSKSSQLKKSSVQSGLMPLSETHEHDLARAFVQHKYPVTLPERYNPSGFPKPKGDMIVIAVKSQKQTREKAIVWVEFLSPPSHAGSQIQLYPKSLEPKHGPAQGADFSLLSAVKEAYPTTTTWSDLGVVPIKPLSSSQATLALLASASAYVGGTRFSADNADMSEASTVTS